VHILLIGVESKVLTFDWLPKRFRRLALYTLCGTSGLILDVGVYSGLVLVGVFYQWANLAGSACGTLLSFSLHRKITFKVHDAPLRRLALFFGVACIGYIMSSLTLWVLVQRHSPR
jgi:putative flippase GtrA